ncbi:MAG: delta-60 repeat domain-containing protein [Caldimonas sp.]
MPERCGPLQRLACLIGAARSAQREAEQLQPFGSRGPPVAGTDSARNVLVQPDGAIVIGGKARIDNPAVGYGLARQSDGKLLLAGRSGQGSAGQFALMRLAADGSSDASFGTAGQVTTTVSAFGDLAHAVAVQADGRILVAGEGSSAGVNQNFQLVRYLSDGKIDSAFASGGKLVIDFSGFADIAESVAVQPDGRIVLGGLGREGPDGGYGLARVNP